MYKKKLDSKRKYDSIRIKEALELEYTFENTNFQSFEVGTKVNLEFDLIGKYISKLYSNK